jgi:DNA-binding IclR family transcriptional regulator
VLDSLELDHELKVILEKGPRKLEILKLIARAKEPLGSDIIADKLKMSKTNVIRILNDLETRDAIRCVTARKRDRRFEITTKGKYHLSSIK